nr:MAG TPA: hypothetical protein [Caudoviricetes sp.]
MRFLRGFMVIRGGGYPTLYGVFRGYGVHTLRYKESFRPPQMIRRCVTRHLQCPKSGHPKHFFLFRVEVGLSAHAVVLSPLLALL